MKFNRSLSRPTTSRIGITKEKKNQSRFSIASVELISTLAFEMRCAGHAQATSPRNSSNRFCDRCFFVTTSKPRMANPFAWEKRLLSIIVLPLILVQSVIVNRFHGACFLPILSLVIQSLQFPLVLLQHLQHLVRFGLQRSASGVLVAESRTFARRCLILSWK